jgi:hypothetical protein
MTPERYQQLKALYRAALEQPEGERATFLIDACSGDEVSVSNLRILPPNRGFGNVAWRPASVLR